MVSCPARQSAIDTLYNLLYNGHVMALTNEPRKLVAVRLKPSAQRTAKVAAVIAGKTMGQWIEEAIQEKAARESNHE